MRSFACVLSSVIFIMSVTAMAQMPIAPKTETSTKLEPIPGRATPPVWTNTDTTFINQYPHLQKNIYQEPDSNYRLGLSAGVVGLVANNLYFSANFFQLHRITTHWDLELLSITYGSTTTQPTDYISNHFVFRDVPKYRWNDFLSFGPLVGYEYISFPNVSTVITKNSYLTRTEPFSTSGLIYGFAVAQTIKTESGNVWRITEVGYQESYSTTDAGLGWTYLYDKSSLRANSSPLAAGLVLTIEVGVLF